MDWKQAYEAAYKAAHGREAVVVETAPGLFVVRTKSGMDIGDERPEEQFPMMTQSLLDAAAAFSTPDALLDEFQSAAVAFYACANPTTEQEHRAHDFARDRVDAARARILATWEGPSA